MWNYDAHSRWLKVGSTGQRIFLSIGAAHTHTECVFVLRDDLCSPSIVHQECPVMGHSTAAVFYARPEPETTDCRVICVYQFQLGTCQTGSACEPNESTVKTHENSIEPTEYFAVRVFFFFLFRINWSGQEQKIAPKHNELIAFNYYRNASNSQSHISFDAHPLETRIDQHADGSKNMRN